MLKKTLVVWGCAAAAALFVCLPCRASEEKGAEDAKALFESKCSVCHSTERPKGKKKDREGWEKTVNRMIKTNRAPITEEESKIITDYLVQNYGP